MESSSPAERRQSDDIGPRNASIETAVAIMRSYRTCEFTTIFRDGTPQTWPVSALLLDDARLLLCTSIGFPQKALNIRHNPKVSLLFSEPRGSGLRDFGSVLVCGDAVVADEVVGDMTATPELAELVRTVCERQPASKVMSSGLGRRIFWSYYLRLPIYVTPSNVWHWPTRDFTQAPKLIDLKELRGVASGG